MKVFLNYITKCIFNDYRKSNTKIRINQFEINKIV